MEGFLRTNLLSCAQNPLHTFPRNFPVDREVANLLATSRCNGIWETTGHNGLLPAPTSYRLRRRRRQRVVIEDRSVTPE